jgi:hypothetical protein
MSTDSEQNAFVSEMLDNLVKGNPDEVLDDFEKLGGR